MQDRIVNPKELWRYAQGTSIAATYTTGLAVYFLGLLDLGLYCEGLSQIIFQKPSRNISSQKHTHETRPVRSLPFGMDSMPMIQMAHSLTGLAIRKRIFERRRLKVGDGDCI